MIDAAAFIGDGLSPVKEAWRHAYSSGGLHSVSQKVFQEKISGHLKGKSILTSHDEKWAGNVFAGCLLYL
jgi:hypothetical protein